MAKAKKCRGFLVERERYNRGVDNSQSVHLEIMRNDRQSGEA
eukprot:CAMPEP_0116861920 /NCGR_PEP_ID=MMETSP0418-20121206/23337_1 /TAXON_ID=1158023 /ORGANISM="Astrosyne radiata, Strain 13vi08-1A" /LENGTH=41 /DNA_ID= /DNA_START= /DNA_END= /DNA_ORIENTATION=